MKLEEAPDHIKLAVDIIQILEENRVPTQTVLDALTIVQHDYEQKLVIDKLAEKKQEP